ncbi:hypothetical protein WDU94_003216 [Cyamophila willieti]
MSTTTTPNGDRPHSMSPELKHRSESPEALISPAALKIPMPPTQGGLPIHIPEHLSIRPVPMKTLTSPPPPHSPHSIQGGKMDPYEGHSAPVDFRIPSAPCTVSPAVVSSSTCSPPAAIMRPPPPPPPLKHVGGKHGGHHVHHHPSSSNHHEEPTSSMPDLGKIQIVYTFFGMPFCR